MYSALDVARKFLEVAGKSDDSSITPMQLIKLAYIAHGWSLGLFGKPLLKDSIEAWKYGPVIPVIYHKVKKFRDKPVKLSGQAPRFDDDHEQLISEIYKVYKKWDGISLSHLTHLEGTPWHTVWSRQGQNARIPDDLIELHYKELYSKRAGEAATAN